MNTKKMYYDNMFLKKCEAQVLDVKGNRVVCNQTIAFPEGGGQIGDRGMIVCENGESIQFVDTQKGVGEILHLSNSHDIQINTPVYHICDLQVLEKSMIESGMKVTILIDVNHRIKTTTLHSALHLVLMGVIDLRPELIKYIKGCHIATDKARIDFFCKDKFTTDEILYINKYCQQLIDDNLEIERYLYQNQNEAWIWKCKDFECPCGGTHVVSTGQLGRINVKRKNVGKTTERLIVTLSDTKISENMYY